MWLWTCSPAGPPALGGASDADDQRPAPVLRPLHAGEVSAGAGVRKGYLIHTLTDETYSLLCTAQPPEGVEAERFYLWVSLLNQLYWIAGSALGGLLGQALPFDTTGVDFAMTALFVVIFTDQWLGRKNHLPALIGVGVSLLSLLCFGPDRFIIPAMAGIALLLMLLRRYVGEEAET